MKLLIVLLFTFFTVISLAQQQPQEGKEGWYRQNSGTQEGLVRVQFFSPTNGWICGQNNAYRTVDAGNTWTPVIPPAQYRFCYFVDDSTAIATGFTPDGKHATVIRTSDRGVTWSDPASPEPAQVSVQAITNMGDTIVLLYQGGTIRSLDRGITWKNYDLEFGDPNAVVFLDHTKGYLVGTPRKFAKTEEGGVSWIDIGNQLPAGLPNTDLHDIEILPNKRLFISGYLRTLMYSDNLGDSWTEIPKLNDIEEAYQAIDFADNVNGLVVGGNGFIYRTTDGGLSWNVQNSHVRYPEDTTKNIYLFDVCMLDSLRAWAVGMGGTILHTTDAGKSWVQPNDKLPSIPSQIVPQPSNGITSLTFSLPSAQNLTIDIFSLSGGLIEQVLYSQYQLAGQHIIPLNLAHLASGQYTYRVLGQNYQSVGTITIIK